jgi:4-amino-4-deoxy-L-arabinose transferase-like glycosyltransferase
LGIGGERAMTLWTMLTGWSAASVLYLLARRHVSRDWSLAIVLLFLTTPAVIYGAGSGQVETRSAAFVLVSTLAVMEARRLDHIGYAALAGLAAGFYAASKYPGLLFVPLAGLAVVLQRRWLQHGLAFAAAALLAAAPFYLWHWWNTGDPFFPMLYGLIEYRPGIPWNTEIHAAFKHWTEAMEKSRPATLLWAAIYPFMATLAPDATFESGRTGFGPIALLLLPLALAGAWMRRDRLRHGPLLIAALLCLGFYLAWFLFGASQRVRHFVPVYPLLLLCLVAAAASAASALRSWRRPLVVATAATLVFQLFVHAVFAIGPARYILGEETRDAYLRRNVIWYDVAHWANAHLPAGSRLLHDQRQLNYLLSVPYFYAHPLTDTRIDQLSKERDPARFWRELAASGITHLLANPDITADGGIHYWAARLLAMGCIKETFRGEVLTFPSRTMMAVSNQRVVYRIFSLDTASCPLDSTPAHKSGTSS